METLRLQLSVFTVYKPKSLYLTTTSTSSEVFWTIILSGLKQSYLVNILPQIFVQNRSGLPVAFRSMHTWNVGVGGGQHALTSFSQNGFLTSS